MYRRSTWKTRLRKSIAHRKMIKIRIKQISSFLPYGTVITYAGSDRYALHMKECGYWTLRKMNSNRYTLEEIEHHEGEIKKFIFKKDVPRKTIKDSEGVAYLISRKLQGVGHNKVFDSIWHSGNMLSIESGGIRYDAIVRKIYKPT